MGYPFILMEPIIIYIAVGIACLLLGIIIGIKIGISWEQLDYEDEEDDDDEYEEYNDDGMYYY